MLADLEALGRRAVAAPGWRWAPGMAAKGRRGTLWRIYMGGGVLCAQGEGNAGGYAAGWSNEWAEILGALPNLSDSATVGCLLAVVREKWAIPTLAPVCKEGVWMLWAGGLPDALYRLRAATEVELLVAALEVPRG